RRAVRRRTGRPSGRSRARCAGRGGRGDARTAPVRPRGLSFFGCGRDSGSGSASWTGAALVDAGGGGRPAALLGSFRTAALLGSFRTAALLGSFRTAALLGSFRTAALLGS
ncbi:hypothetical protein GT016_33685, partial [Streptomyces sp. SID3915]|nr:hypothetical protein [Streptomyces sp. SID3915]